MRIRTRRPGKGHAGRAARRACLLAALACPALSASDALPDFRWSPDGSTLAVVERDDRTAVAVRLVDGATGAVRGRLAGDRLAASLGQEAVRAGRDLWVVPGGSRVVFSAGERAALWTVASGDVARLEELDGRTHGAQLAPDGRHLAYLRDGSLWSLALDSGRTVQLSRDVDVGSELAWSPDGRSLAYAARDTAGKPHVEVVDLEDAAPRRLETEPLGSAVALRWRFDAGAVGVVTRVADGSRLELALCHALRSYCRPFARRAWSDDREQVDDLRFLADGFLWGSADGAGPLALYDTLGRERRRLLPADHRLLGIAAVFAPTREVVVATQLVGEARVTRLLLIDLRSGARQEIASGVGWPPAAISESLRAWIRPRKSAAGDLEGYLLERIDGTPILAFTHSGAPVAR